MISDEEIQFLTILSKILSGLSIISIVFIIFCILKWSNMNIFSTELILVLFVLELCSSVGLLLPSDTKNRNYDGYCTAQSIILPFFSTSAAIWIGCLAYTSWHSFNSTSLVDENKNKYRLIYSLAAFITPALVVLL